MYIEKHLRTVSSDCQKMIKNILQLVNEQPAAGIHNASMKIENSCQILEKSIQNEVVGVGSF